MSHPIIRRSLLAFMATTALVFSTGALAWGPEGHAIVADIATLHLDTQALSQIHQLLGLEGHHSLDQVSSWPDEIRRDQPQTGPWHYVDIPLDATRYDPARDCVGGDCVVARIPYFAKILGDRSASPQDRLQALKYLVHLVGDIHQPLHTEDDHDKGGNTVKEDFFNHHTNLHAMWDGAILEHALNLHLGPHYSFDHAAVLADARSLDKAITPAQRTRWAPQRMSDHLLQASVQWADQSHALARKVAYPDLPAEPKDGWSETYEAKIWPVVKTQLLRAGVRLAAVLNHTLR